jgi:hypothetical protein
VRRRPREVRVRRVCPPVGTYGDPAVQVMHGALRPLDPNPMTARRVTSSVDALAMLDRLGGLLEQGLTEVEARLEKDGAIGFDVRGGSLALDHGGRAI